MRGVAFWFLVLGVLSGLLGMVWGIQMAATGNHTLSPAHGHLNLIGWVSLVLFAFYYHTVPAAAVSRLAKLHFGVAALGLVIIVPGIAMAISGSGETLAKVGSLITLISMLVFGAVVLRTRES
ncbi:MAG: hypothetical protein HKN30_08465 [Sulfitobacter sp.]|nr:hypothetical protein [Sulfitobacter sp.]